MLAHTLPREDSGLESSPPASMAEGLGVVASAIAVIQISEQVISACYQYYRTAKDAKKDIIDVINVVGGLKSTLENLRMLLYENADSDGHQQLCHLRLLRASLKTCKESIETLAMELGVNIEQDSGATEIKLNFKKKLMWPWKEKEIGKILAVIEKHKSTFILAITGDILGVTVSMQENVEDIKDGIAEFTVSLQTMRMDQKQKEVLNWLKCSDPSINHESACNKREPTTGNWFLETENFIEWTEGRHASLWLDGIPGAGKPSFAQQSLNTSSRYLTMTIDMFISTLISMILRNNLCLG